LGQRPALTYINGIGAKVLSNAATPLPAAMVSRGY